MLMKNIRAIVVARSLGRDMYLSLQGSIIRILGFKYLDLAIFITVVNLCSISLCLVVSLRTHKYRRCSLLHRDTNPST